jgi:two-component system OmpR family response regulator
MSVPPLRFPSHVIDVAVVGSSPEELRILGRHLAAAGFRPHLLTSDELDECLDSTTCRIVVVDLDQSGEAIALVTQTSARHSVYVVLLGDSSGPAWRREGYDANADYCLDKPVALPELAAILCRIDRRTAHAASSSTWWLARDLRRLTAPSGEVIPLTELEVRFLSLLGQAPDRSLVREALQLGMWEDTGPHLVRRLEVMIHRFRQKLSRHGISDDPIQTRWRTGYSFGPTMVMDGGRIVPADDARADELPSSTEVLRRPAPSSRASASLKGLR